MYININFLFTWHLKNDTIYKKNTYEISVNKKYAFTFNFMENICVCTSFCVWKIYVCMVIAFVLVMELVLQWVEFFVTNVRTYQCTIQTAP